MLRPSCSLAALQLSQLQPLTAMRSLQLPCASCWLLIVLLLGLITATGLVMECSGDLHTSVATQRLDRGTSIRVESCKLGIAVRRRFWRNAAAFEGLSALTQLTRLATDYDSSTQHEAQYSWRS